VLTNAELEHLVDTSDEWIRSRTGISERRIIDEGAATSDLVVEAAALAMTRSAISPADVDLLIVATATPDHLMPATACVAQHKLGLSCPAFDLNAACSGFVYALQVAASAIESGRADTVLVVGADALSRIIDWSDRSTCVLFGDGAGAVVLQASQEPGVLSVVLGSDGAGGDLLKIPSGGSADPCGEGCSRFEDPFLRMNGPEVFKFAVKVIPAATTDALARSGYGVDDLTWLVPHQANKRILDTVEARLGISHDRVYSNLEHVGNTSAASIPLALDDLYTGGRLMPGDLLALVGFGAGLTWAAAVVRWNLDIPHKEA
jgi:3-oxoacyl-[acyl-carrier-protein] synthase-3